MPVCACVRVCIQCKQFLFYCRNIMAAVSHLQQVKIPIEFRFDMINFDTVGGRTRVKYIVHSRVCVCRENANENRNESNVTQIYIMIDCQGRLSIYLFCFYLLNPNCHKTFASINMHNNTICTYVYVHQLTHAQARTHTQSHTHTYAYTGMYMSSASSSCFSLAGEFCVFFFLVRFFYLFLLLHDKTCGVSFRSFFRFTFCCR